MSTWVEFKECVRIQGGLDIEALDVMFVQPLKDLHAWWQRQSDFTKAWINVISGGLGATALGAFIAKVAGITAAELALAVSEALGAAFVGLTLGVVIDVLGRCSIQLVQDAVV